MKKLYIIRHAKSSWKDNSLSDFDRPLNSRGKIDALLIGEVLSENDIRADKIYTSTANRAISTAKIIAEKTKTKEALVEMPNFYHASAELLLNEINKFEDAAQTVFMFGHNPGFTYLAEMLTGEPFGNIPTCGVVGVKFDFASWELISANTGEVIAFEYPKKYK